MPPSQMVSTIWLPFFIHPHIVGTGDGPQSGVNKSFILKGTHNVRDETLLLNWLAGSVTHPHIVRVTVAPLMFSALRERH